MNPLYTPAKWYWIVAGSKTQVYSSAAAGYVPVTDKNYQVLAQHGFTPTSIAVEQDLFDLLIVAGVPVPAGATQSAASQAQEDASVPPAVKKAIDKAVNPAAVTPKSAVKAAAKAAA